MMVPIPEGLILDLYAKYTMPSTLSSKYSKKSIRNVMWEVVPVSRIHAYTQEANQVSNTSSVTPILQWETTCALPSVDYELLTLSSLIFSHGTLQLVASCDPFFPQ
jgi:hypothetical protein